MNTALCRYHQAFVSFGEESLGTMRLNFDKIRKRSGDATTIVLLVSNLAQHRAPLWNHYYDGHSVDIVDSGFQKDFDLVSHGHLAHKLSDHGKIRGILKSTTSYCRSRK